MIDNINNKRSEIRNKVKDKCTYPNMLDRIFSKGSNLKTNNMVGMYVGDNLYAKFDNNTESETMNKNNEQNLNNKNMLNRIMNKKKGLYTGDSLYA